MTDTTKRKQSLGTGVLLLPSVRLLRDVTVTLTVGLYVILRFPIALYHFPEIGYAIG